jgi:hypothetical protein
MARLNVPLTEDEIKEIQAYASREQVPVESLIRNYLTYLIAGGKPVSPEIHDLPSSEEIARIGEHGGAFNWLAEEPEMYSDEDGEPV